MTKIEPEIIPERLQKNWNILLGGGKNLLSEFMPGWDVNISDNGLVMYNITLAFRGRDILMIKRGPPDPSIADSWDLTFKSTVLAPEAKGHAQAIIAMLDNAMEKVQEKVTSAQFDHALMSELNAISIAFGVKPEENPDLRMEDESPFPA